MWKKQSIHITQRGLGVIILFLAAVVCSLLSCEMDSKQSVECLSDEICQNKYGEGWECVEGNCRWPEPQKVAIQVFPPNNTELAVHQVLGVEVDPRMRALDLHLKAPRLFSGQVRFPKNDDEEVIPIPSRIVFQASQKIPNTSLHEDVHTFNADSGDFEVPLVSKIEYDIMIYPDSSHILPYKLRNFEINDDTQLLFSLPSTDKYPLLTGTLLRIDPNSQLQVPVEGAEVFAMMEIGGIGSTIAKTDSYGVFRLFLPPDVETYSLKIRPSEDNPSVPEMNTDLFTIDGEENWEYGEIVMGEFGNSFVWDGVVLGSMDEPIHSVTISLSSHVGEGNYHTQTVSDEEGHFQVSLLPGTYRIQLVTLSQDSYASSDIDNFLIENQSSSGHEFFLEPKLIFSSSVLDGNGEPLIDTFVKAEPVSQNTVESFPEPAYTDEEGQFSLMLDPGTYNFIFIPSEESNLPRWIEQDVEVYSAQDDKIFTVVRSSMVLGRVLDPEREPVPDSRVEIFSVDEYTNTAILIGNGLTDDEGSFEIIIPVMTSSETK